MTSFFIACAVLGGGVVVAQLVLGSFGGGDHDGAGHDVGGHDHHIGSHDHDSGAHGHASAGLNLLSIRAFASGFMMFGLGGLLGLELSLGLLSLVIALAMGLVAHVSTAYIMRAMLGFDQDRTLKLEHAIGGPGVVYLTIPAELSGEGKVHVKVQERLIECPAVTPNSAIPTGTAVMVVDVDWKRPGTLVVVNQNQLVAEANHV
jgi:membrane protein implicated in regulation of membrane protease activity